MIVVDTNVLAALLLPSEQSPVAEEVFLKDSDWQVPLLGFSELRNVAMVFHRRGLADRTALTEMMSTARMLVNPQGPHLPSDESVLALACTSGCSAYDCEFVAIAQELRVPLVTWDRQVLRARCKIAR
jgi:predicted nucleic acid-binding protein